MDNLEFVWNNFFEERSASLFKRFPGHYRAVVVETNDPLQFHRIRFKCPELHNFDLSPEDCPWAVPAPWMGGKNAGSWGSPVIGDVIWVVWEKNHPYGPIWCGFAMGTRRKRYALESIYTESPLSVNEDGEPDDSPEDFLKEYLPKDLRPMSLGWRDRYGNFDVSRSVGYFPIEHDTPPSVVGTDAISQSEGSEFTVGITPKVNDPDQKYLVRCTKYGGYQIMSDVGYSWKKQEDSDVGEFLGDADKDRDFEVKRFKNLTKLFNEDSPTGNDQRRHEIRTRAGHKWEMRDVGWAQQGGGRSGNEDVGPTKTRPDEYDEERIISENTTSDERWMKMRTKGGMLFQAMDMGFHPGDDLFYARPLIEETGATPDLEEEAEWTKRDARQIRAVTRYGSKIVLDDRGSSPTDAEGNSEEKANGAMIKTRRGWQQDGTGDTGNPTGFGFEMNDKDELNTTRLYTPKSKILELNDKHDYAMIATDTAEEISRPWQKLRENEFALKIAMTENPELDTYHMKLDKFNGYVRFKTSGGNDNGRRPTNPDEFLDVEETGINQGLEARDGRNPPTAFGEGAWVELVDIRDRGLWFSDKQKLSALRSNDNQYIAIIDKEDSPALVIRNNVDGPLQLFCLADVQVIGENVTIKAQKKISLEAGQEISMSAGGTQAVLRRGEFGTNGNLRAQEIIARLPGAFPGNGAQSPSPIGSSPLKASPVTASQIKPTDRGATSGDFSEIDENIIKGDPASNQAGE